MPELPKCAICNTEFLPVRYRQKVCYSPDCRRKASSARMQAWRVKKKLAREKTI